MASRLPLNPKRTVGIRSRRSLLRSYKNRLRREMRLVSRSRSGSEANCPATYSTTMNSCPSQLTSSKKLKISNKPHTNHRQLKKVLAAWLQLWQPNQFNRMWSPTSRARSIKLSNIIHHSRYRQSSSKPPPTSKTVEGLNTHPCRLKSTFRRS